MRKESISTPVSDLEPVPPLLVTKASNPIQAVGFVVIIDDSHTFLNEQYQNIRKAKVDPRNIVVFCLNIKPEEIKKVEVEEGSYREGFDMIRTLKDRVKDVAKKGKLHILLDMDMSTSKSEVLPPNRREGSLLLELMIKDDEMRLMMSDGHIGITITSSNEISQVFPESMDFIELEDKSRVKIFVDGQNKKMEFSSIDCQFTVHKASQSKFNLTCLKTISALLNPDQAKRSAAAKSYPGMKLMSEFLEDMEISYDQISSRSSLYSSPALSPTIASPRHQASLSPLLLRRDGVDKS